MCKTYPLRHVEWRVTIATVAGRQHKNSSKISGKKSTIVRGKKPKNSRDYKRDRRSTTIVSSSNHVSLVEKLRRLIAVKRGRGRPKKYHLGFLLTHWWYAKLQLTRWFFGLLHPNTETRGRKRLSLLVRYRRWQQARERRKLQQAIKNAAIAKARRQRLLKLLHLSRQRGRPRKSQMGLQTSVWHVLLLARRTGHFVREYKQTFASLFFSIALVSLAFGGFVYFFADLPAASDLSAKDQAISTKILDRNGEILYRIYEDENRTLVPLSRVSPYLIQATIAIEDKDFYHHFGFSPSGILRALLANFKDEEIQQGGSTITQQLVKNRLLSPERTVKRKVRELVLALVVEGVYTKDEILEMYLNQVPYGGSTYGIEEAAWRYFNKSARDLTLAESALLAGLPAAPSVYTPFGPNPELAYARQEEVYRRMLTDGMVTPEQVQAARAQQLVFNNDATDIKAPHFVMYVRQLLAAQFGEDVLTKGGLEVRTTLDLQLQQAAQKLLTDEVTKLKPLRINNGAALVTNPQTGEILAMIGSKNYFDFAHDGQVNVVLRERQPGSSIKPLTYATSMELMGRTPASIIVDAPISFSSPGSPPYAPKNYDGKFHGNVTIRESLASSYNIPAVKVLNEIGINNFIDQATAMGISTWQDRTRFGLSLTLGGGEVKMIDLAQAYSTFATEGYAVKPTALLEVRNYKGELLYRNECALRGQTCGERQVLSPAVSYLITNILSDNQARSPAFGFNSVLTIPGQEVAVKTGTTNSMRDNWTIGYTTDRLVAVWVGNNDNTPMSYVASGITGASPIWNKIMRLLLDEKNPHAFVMPSGVVKVAVCGKTGTLPCTGCPQVRQEVFVAGTEPRRSCSPVVFSKPKDEAATTH